MSTVNILRRLCADSAQPYLNSHSETDNLNFREQVSKQKAFSQFANVKQGYLNVKDYANKVDEISEYVMDISTEFENIESRDQFFISVFINGSNFEMTNLIGIKIFGSYNICF